jgi:hypothetical protein
MAPQPELRRELLPPDLLPPYLLLHELQALQLLLGGHRPSPL